MRIGDLGNRCSMIESFFECALVSLGRYMGQEERWGSLLQGTLELPISTTTAYTLSMRRDDRVDGIMVAFGRWKQENILTA
jgi:hypothetical protein